MQGERQLFDPKTGRITTILYLVKNEKFAYQWNERTQGWDTVTRASYKNKRRAKNRVARKQRKANR